MDPEGPDGEPISLFESGAILPYLAAKTGLLLPTNVRGRYEVLQWLMFQMGGVGPMRGQAHHFRIYAPEKISYAIERYTNKARRLYGVLNRRLARSRHIGGAEHSMAASPSSHGCAVGGTRASTGTTIRTSGAGSTRSARARRCSMAWRCWPASAGPW